MQAIAQSLVTTLLYFVSVPMICETATEYRNKGRPNLKPGTIARGERELTCTGLEIRPWCLNLASCKTSFRSDGSYWALAGQLKNKQPFAAGQALNGKKKRRETKDCSRRQRTKAVIGGFLAVQNHDRAGFPEPT